MASQTASFNLIRSNRSRPLQSIFYQKPSYLRGPFEGDGPTIQQEYQTSLLVPSPPSTNFSGCNSLTSTVLGSTSTIRNLHKLHKTDDIGARLSTTSNTGLSHPKRLVPLVDERIKISRKPIKLSLISSMIPSVTAHHPPSATNPSPGRQNALQTHGLDLTFSNFSWLVASELVRWEPEMGGAPLPPRLASPEHPPRPRRVPSHKKIPGSGQRDAFRFPLRNRPPKSTPHDDSTYTPAQKQLKYKSVSLFAEFTARMAPKAGQTTESYEEIRQRNIAASR
ncbi:hypothetical protein PtB15_3B130 [Puccinia triticina]|nr:hypothetical protein PtB15_3B130 [Puccinia triticina]